MNAARRRSNVKAFAVWLRHAWPAVWLFVLTGFAFACVWTHKADLVAVLVAMAGLGPFVFSKLNASDAVKKPTTPPYTPPAPFPKPPEPTK